MLILCTTGSLEQPQFQSKMFKVQVAVKAVVEYNSCIQAWTEQRWELRDALDYGGKLEGNLKKASQTGNVETGMTTDLYCTPFSSLENLEKVKRQTEYKEYKPLFTIYDGGFLGLTLKA